MKHIIFTKFKNDRMKANRNKFVVYCYLFILIQNQSIWVTSVDNLIIRFSWLCSYKSKCVIHYMSRIKYTADSNLFRWHWTLLGCGSGLLPRFSALKKLFHLRKIYDCIQTYLNRNYYFSFYTSSHRAYNYLIWQY